MLFADGFKDFLESSEFYDVELVTERRTYKVHKLMLMYSSEFFAKLLTSKFKESTQQRIEIKFEDSEDLFPEILNFIYSGLIDINEQNAIPLLALADQLLINSLISKTSDFILNCITQANAIMILESSLQFNVSEIVEKCVDIVAKNFWHYTDTDWNFVPPKVFLKLLHQEYLTIKDEYTLYKIIRSYVSYHQKTLSQEDITKFMESIRFRWIECEDLKKIQCDSLVPENLIIEALFARLQSHESPGKPTDLSNTRLKPRAKFGKQFEYKYDFDENGILFWIATKGKKSPWQNPHLKKLIKVTAPSNNIIKGHPSELVSRNPSELWTGDVPASWFAIDLGESRTIIPTHYRLYSLVSLVAKNVIIFKNVFHKINFFILKLRFYFFIIKALRHGANYKGDSLRNWDLQGSNDGINWVVLKRHTNDASLKNGKFATQTWKIEKADTDFRYLRILQTGHNSSSHNFLVLSGIEFYGDLYEFDVSHRRLTSNN
eukprot:TRINITY_DN5622_c1_g1_i2.p1 TRINITY_DN5622_c1_g1~~TRINITY_DN5622_c1_g1_i2.p1  ORF type:complete len:489 (+),score=134.71 TRINITY_DN5622_c1_g1_i2:132-1598(+)